MQVIDAKFATRWRAYLLQAGAATACLVVALVVIEGVANFAVVSAIASSTFLTFFAPKSLMARPRNTFGGHAVAVIVTLAFSPLIDDPILPSLLDNNVATDLLAAVAVGLTMLLMAVTNTEHAPAAGTALGLSLQAWDVEAAISVLAIAAFLVAVQTLGRGRLENLL